MNQKFLLASMLLAIFLVGCGDRDVAHADVEAGHEHDTPARDEATKGQHGGRLLVDGAFVLELAIFEDGVAPEYRAWATSDGKPLKSSAVTLKVELARLGGRVDRIAFASAGDFLRGSPAVAEPHSFDVKVSAIHEGRSHQWSYESYEGRTRIEADAALEAGIGTAVVGAGTIVEALGLYGAVVPDAARLREVKARFPGVIRRVTRQVGDRVRAGETLAMVESNESLQVFAVTAPIGGVVTLRHAETGEQADGQALFEIADFSTVWAEFGVFPRDRSRLRAGLPVRVLGESGQQAEGHIDYVAPLGSRDTQSVTARVTLDNAEGQWTPGQFVEARIAVAQSEAALVLPLSALQTFRDFTVAFEQVGEVYEVRVLTLGRRDADRVEVLGGLTPGSRVVVKNSYLIKADIEKSGASHDH